MCLCAFAVSFCWTVSGPCSHCREKGGPGHAFQVEGEFLFFQARGHCRLGDGFRVSWDAITNLILLLNQWEVAGEEGDVFLPS